MNTANVGWVSNGPVQINVGGDLHVHGGARPAFDCPDDCGQQPRGSVEPGFIAKLHRCWRGVLLIWFLVCVFARGVWFLLNVIFWVGVAALVLVAAMLALCVVLPALAIALGLWTVARAGQLVLWIERMLGGGPTRLAYLMTPWSSNQSAPVAVADSELESVGVKQLAPGNGSLGLELLQPSRVETSAVGRRA